MRLITPSFIAASFALALFTGSANGETFRAKVTRIIDGDTIVIAYHGRPKTIRLQAIDAPEKLQTGGPASKENMRRLVEGRTVTVETQARPDRYGRTVGKVIADGMDVGLEQIRQGHARHYKKYQSKQTPQDRRAYSETDKAARHHPDEQTPEQFRRKPRN